MKIVILAAGETNFDVQDDAYPLCLAELDGKPLIQLQIEACGAINNSSFNVALRDEDIRRFHIDNVVSLLSPTAKITRVPGASRGAACTALLAVGDIDNDEELLILNGNELLDFDFNEVIERFRRDDLDAGVVTFQSVHPRYSYVRTDDSELVVEAAEKEPISRNATVGFYWFSKGRDFVSAAKEMIRKDASVNGLFYISPILNELVLVQKRIGVYKISQGQYHPLKNEHQINQYDLSINSGK